VRFDEKVDTYIPARYRFGHLRRLMVSLESETAGSATNLNRPIQQISERLTKRGMVVLISDLLAPLDDFEKHLGYLTAQGHEVAVFQILDPAEISFDFSEPALFQDVESGRELYIDPETVRSQYQEEFNAHLAEIETICSKLGVGYHRHTTDQPLEMALGEFLKDRSAASSANPHRINQQPRKRSSA